MEIQMCHGGFQIFRTKKSQLLDVGSIESKFDFVARELMEQSMFHFL